METNRSVTSLDMCDTRIGGTGARAFGRALRVNWCLTTLDLSENSTLLHMFTVCGYMFVYNWQELRQYDHHFPQEATTAATLRIPPSHSSTLDDHCILVGSGPFTTLQKLHTSSHGHFSLFSNQNQELKITLTPLKPTRLWPLFTRHRGGGGSSHSRSTDSQPMARVSQPREFEPRSRGGSLR